MEIAFSNISIFKKYYDMCSRDFVIDSWIFIEKIEFNYRGNNFQHHNETDGVNSFNNSPCIILRSDKCITS